MKILKVVHSYILKRKAPLNYQDSHAHLFDMTPPAQFEIPEMKVLQLFNVHLFEDGSIIKNNKVIEEAIRDSAMIQLYTKWLIFKRNLLFKKIKLDNSKIYITALDHWGSEYYHFLLEALPRIIFIQSHLTEDFTLILSQRYQNNYIKVALEKLGISQILYIKSKTRVTCSNLIISTYAGPSDFHRSSLLVSIREKLTHNIKNTTGPNKKIYLSRAKATRRTLINETEVKRYLEENGYETIYAKELSFIDQINIFSNAKHLISLHGAGLSNILFMSPGSRVTELRKENWGIIPETGIRETSKFYNTYYHMCLAQEVEYTYIASPSDSPETSARYANLEVSIDELSSCLL